MSLNNDRLAWGLQPHFRVHASSTAEAIFGTLDPRLFRRLFMVCMPAQGENEEDLFLFPEDAGYPIRVFENLAASINMAREADSLRHVEYGDMPSRVAHQEALRKRSVAEALRNRMQEAAMGTGIRIVVAIPEQVRDHDVYVVLELWNHALADVPRISKVTQSNPLVRQPLSLLDAVIDQLFDDLGRGLQLREPGLGAVARRPEEILRAAASLFAKGIAWSLGGMDYGLFEHLCILSAMTYEGQPGRGGILLARRNEVGIESLVRLVEPISLDSYRAVRKLLETAYGDLFLLSDASKVYGLCRWPTNAHGAAEAEIYEVKFHRQHHWSLHRAGQTLFEVKYEKPRLPKKRYDDAHVRDVLKRELGSQGLDLESLMILVEAASGQTHGTVLVVSADAKNEADRLTTSSTTIEPLALTPEILTQLSSIDGAVIIDPSGTCFAIGAILDGLATQDRGDKARGARYNSSLRYVTSNRGRCVALVVSEDGMVDIQPALMPRIPAATIPGLIDQLQRMSDESVMNRELFHQVLGTLRSLEFYLRQEDANRINQLVKELTRRLHAQKSATLGIEYPPLASSKDVDDTYFFPEEP